MTKTYVVVASALAVMLGALGLNGGLSSAGPEKLDIADQPVALRAAPLDIVIRNSYTVENARIVEADITNTSSVSMSSYDFGRGVKLIDSKRSQEDQPDFLELLRRRESDVPLKEVPRGPLPPLNPGVPMQVLIVFESDGKAADEETSRALEADTLQIWSREYRKTPIDGSLGWWLGDVVAEVMLQ